MARKAGDPIPEALADKPELEAGLDFYWYAFWEMSSDRQIGMAEGPIPWSTMDRWSRRHDIVGDEFDRLLIMIKNMDGVYLKHRAKARTKSLSKAGAQKPKEDKVFIKTKAKGK